MEKTRTIKTIEEAGTTQGVSIIEDGTALNLHFDPMLNWYGCVLGFNCPRCENEITWEWVGGDLPGITNPSSIAHSQVHPTVTGAELNQWGHRHISVTCPVCNTYLHAENYD